MDNVERQIAEFLDEVVANVKKERVKRGVSQLALAGILGHKFTKYTNFVAKKRTACLDCHALSSQYSQ